MSSYSVGMRGWKLSKTFRSRKVCFGLVQIVAISSAPMKAFALGAFDTAGVDASLLKDFFLLRAKVLAHHRHDADLREIAGGQ